MPDTRIGVRAGDLGGDRDYTGSARCGAAILATSRAGGFPWGPDKGEVKLINAAKDAEVYIDGAFAGQAGGLKSMWMSPGAYDIEVRGAKVVKKRVYVLSGKVLRIQ